ncbi:MAG: hemolysin III family protein [Planctomycetota bacterium]
MNRERAAVVERGDRKSSSIGEEIANSVTHGVGFLLGVVALVLVVVLSALHGTALHVVSGAIYGSTLILLYSASTLYHAFPPGRAKRVFRVLDHSAIFLLIAGTYTPFTLVTLGGSWGWSLFGVIWGLAVAGVVLETVAGSRLRVLQVILYLAMGWMAVVAGRPLLGALDTVGLVLLFAGGLCYTLGVVFYVWRRLPFHHAVWHVFVLGGSACHFFAVLLSVIP